MHHSLIEQHSGEARSGFKTGGRGDTLTSPGRGRSQHHAREGFLINHTPLTPFHYHDCSCTNVRLKKTNPPSSCLLEDFKKKR